MRAKPRKLKSGKTVWDFVWWDSNEQKPKKLARNPIMDALKSQEEADEYARQQSTHLETSKRRIQEKLAWKTKFHNFEKLAKLYEKEAQRTAPNSWENTMYYLDQYVIYFFLTKKECSNANFWSSYYKEFKTWLVSDDVGVRKTKRGKMSYSTANHCISALNSFMVFLKDVREVGELEKCEKYGTEFLNARGIDDVIRDDEMLVIEEKLKKLDPTEEAYQIFKVLNNTGLRIHEFFGLSLANLFVGIPEHETYKILLERNKLTEKTLGYLFINSQVADRKEFRNEEGAVVRKPLKGKRNIEKEEGRIIPIFDAEVFDILAARFNIQVELYKKKKYGKDEENYLLFENYNNATYSGLLQKAYAGIQKWKPKTPHCSRHTYSTNFVGRIAVLDFGFCKLCLGHSDEETSQRYIHIFQAINREASKQTSRMEGIKLIKKTGE